MINLNNLGDIGSLGVNNYLVLQLIIDGILVDNEGNFIVDNEGNYISIL